MTQSIGEILSTSIILDASGMRTGVERGVQALNVLESTAVRTGQTLAQMGDGTEEMANAIRRAAEMVEVLSLKMVAMDKTASESTGTALNNRIVAWKSFAAEQKAVLQRIHDEVDAERQREMAALRADITQRLELQERYRRQWAAEEASFLQRVHNEVETERQREMAALAADITQRLNLQQTYHRQWAAEQAAFTQRLRSEAEEERAREMAALQADITARLTQRQRFIDKSTARLNADADRARGTTRPADAMFTRPDTISQNFRAIARDAVAWERANTQVGQMQERIARMRAELNPMVGMQARLAQEAAEFAEAMRAAEAAGRLTGLQVAQMTRQFREQQSQLMARANSQQMSFGGMRNVGFAVQQAAYAAEDAATVYGTMGLAGAFRAAGNNLSAMASVAGPWVGVAASLGVTAAALAVNMWDVGDSTNKAREAEEKLAEQRERQLQTQKALIDNEQQLAQLRGAATFGTLQSGLSGQMGNAVEDTAKLRASNLASQVATAERRIKFLEETIANTGMIHMHQRARLAQVLLAEQTALEALKNQGQFWESPQGRIQIRQEQREAAIGRSVEVRDKAIADARAGDQKRNVIEIRTEIRTLEMERLNLLERQYDSEVDLIQGMQMQFDLMERQVELEKQIATIRKEAERAVKAANDQLQSRMEAMFPLLRIENDMVRARKELNEQLEIGIRAGTITQQQAARQRAELERIFQLEEAQRARQKREEALNKRKSLLEKALQDSPKNLVTSGVQFGTEEALRIMEQERLSRIQAKEQEPIVNELRAIRAELQKIKQINEQQENFNPQVAQL